jgi:WD40 repeat protein
MVRTDRHLLVTGSCDASCKLFDLRTGGMLAKFVHPKHLSEEVRPGPCGGSSGGALTLRWCAPQVRSVQFRGQKLITGCYDGFVREFELTTGSFRVSGRRSELELVMADDRGANAGVGGARSAWWRTTTGTRSSAASSTTSGW